MFEIIAFSVFFFGAGLVAGVFLIFWGARRFQDRQVKPANDNGFPVFSILDGGRKDGR